MTTTVYVDFDGVFHPTGAYLVAGKPTMKNEDGALFQWAFILESLLKEYNDIDIRLSTSWCFSFSYVFAMSQLPEGLRSRVTGCTVETLGRDFARYSRYEQIESDARAMNIKAWIAIDDDVVGWPDRIKGRLVATDGWKGLSDPQLQETLKQKLIEMSKK